MCPGVNTLNDTTTRTDWLNLARENAACSGDDPADLGRAIVRLATLAAAAHRAQETIAQPAAASAADASIPEWAGRFGGSARGSV